MTGGELYRALLATGCSKCAGHYHEIVNEFHYLKKLANSAARRPDPMRIQKVKASKAEMAKARAYALEHLAAEHDSQVAS